MEIRVYVKDYFKIMLDSYTRNAEESDFIKETVCNNYGVLTPLIAQELMCNSEKWNKCKLYWKGALKKRISEEKIILNTADRIVDYVALFAMSCSLLSTVVGIEFDVDKVVDFLYLHMIFKNSEDSNIGFRAYEVIKQYIAQHKSRFVPTFDEWMTPELPDDAIGFFLDKTYSSYQHKDAKGNVYALLYIFPEKTMEKLLMDYGFADVKVVMKDMKKAKEKHFAVRW